MWSISPQRFINSFCRPMARQAAARSVGRAGAKWRAQGTESSGPGAQVAPFYMYMHPLPAPPAEPHPPSPAGAECGHHPLPSLEALVRTRGDSCKEGPKEL